MADTPVPPARAFACGISLADAPRPHPYL